MDQIAPHGSQQSQQATWIVGRVQTLLSHYFQPDHPMDVQDQALVDWVKALSPFPASSIERACADYLCNQPRRRPTPADIRGLAETASRQSKGELAGQMGDRNRLTRDEMHALETRVLPQARAWLGVPSLRHHGEKTLEFWGEHVPGRERDA